MEINGCFITSHNGTIALVGFTSNCLKENWKKKLWYQAAGVFRALDETQKALSSAGYQKDISIVSVWHDNPTQR